jgi:hypothetical protein
MGREEFGRKWGLVFDAGNELIFQHRAQFGTSASPASGAAVVRSAFDAFESFRCLGFHKVEKMASDACAEFNGRLHGQVSD